jgi:geranylgeranyl pyrophosphate synthase
MIEQLKRALRSCVHLNDLSTVMDYAVFPAGKLFRPRLIEALALDLAGKISDDIVHLACAIELHHAYTLVHDDLPSMDNDFIRRGKPSTHAKHGEWKAILAGDALLIASFHELAQIRHPDAQVINRLFAWATGAKGLILGQYLDLGADGKLPMEEVIRVHELKTARLIQVGTLGTHILSRKNPSLKDTSSFLRFGREIGVAFQLLDDLGELTEREISSHEKLINPFIVSPDHALSSLKNSHLRFKDLIKAHSLMNTDKMMKAFFKAGQSKIELNFQNVRSNVVRTVVTDLEKWVTTFV